MATPGRTYLDSRLTVKPFELPLTREQFARALEAGHRRAILHARQCGVDGLQDLIVDACLHYKVHDPQCEADRWTWMIELIEAADLVAFVASEFMRRVGEVSPGWLCYDLHLRCDVAASLMERGCAGTMPGRGNRVLELPDTGSFSAL